MRNCPAGTRVSRKPTKALDRVCANCNGVTQFQTAVGQLTDTIQLALIRLSCRRTKTRATQSSFALRLNTRRQSPPRALTEFAQRIRCLKRHAGMGADKPALHRCVLAAACSATQYLAGSCGGGSDNTGKTECRSCHASCGSCTGPTSSQCTSCNGLNVLHSGTCLSDCPVGTYADAQVAKAHESVSWPCLLTSLLQGRCVSCDATCRTCDTGSSTGCTACSGTFERDVPAAT